MEALSLQCNKSTFMKRDILNLLDSIRKIHLNSEPQLSLSDLSLNVNLSIIRGAHHSKFVDALRNVLAEQLDNLINQNDKKRRQSIQIFNVMIKLDWHNIYASAYMDVLHDRINACVRDYCVGVYDATCIGNIQDSLSKSLIPLYSTMFGPFISKTDIEPPLLQYMHESLCKVRASELFDIVAEFPESLNALKELREAVNLSRGNMMSYIANVFRDIINKRLLHSGASTSQILDMYIAMIKSLRILDPSDLILNFVAVPVRAYLTHRKDTVRCIVASLTQQGGSDSDLHLELRRGGSLEYGDDEDDEEGGPGDAWLPRVRNPDLSSTVTGSSSRGLDVLALLVSIYGSTDIFVNEYRILLADKLMSNLTYHTDHEVSTLELLKIRFGEESLHSCEVMLHDLEESKRINNVIASDLQKARSNNRQQRQYQFPQVDYVVVSDNYWPALQDEAMSHHPTATALLDAFESAYAEAKKPRKLHRMDQLGTVDLDLDFDDGTIRSFSVSPSQASLILHIADVGQMSLSELAQRTDLDPAAVRKRMQYWLARRVVRELPSAQESDGAEGDVVYAVIEDQADFADDVRVEDTELGDAKVTVSSEAQEKASMLKLNDFIFGMLTSHSAMTIERIHTMLKLLAAGSGPGSSGEMKFDMNLVQFKRHLQSLIDSDKIEFVDGAYRMRPK